MPVAGQLSLPGDHRSGSAGFDDSLDPACRPVHGPRKPSFVETLPSRTHRQLTSAGRSDQVADSDQVARHGREREHPADPAHTPVTQFVQEAELRTRRAPPCRWLGSRGCPRAGRSDSPSAHGPGTQLGLLPSGLLNHAGLRIGARFMCRIAAGFSAKVEVGVARIRVRLS